MQYLVREDIDTITTQQELVRLTDDEKQAPNEPLIEDIIKLTNSIIDDSLRVSYKVPLQEVPIVIKNICKSIAKYELYKLRTAVNQNLQKEYSDAIKLLNDYAIGRKVLRLETSQKDIKRTGIIRQPRKSFFEDTDHLL